MKRNAEKLSTRLPILLYLVTIINVLIFGLVFFFGRLMQIMTLLVTSVTTMRI